MKKAANRFVQIICALFLTIGVYAQPASTGIFQTYAVLDIDNSGNQFFHGGANDDGSINNFDGRNLGNINSLVLNGGEIKTFKEFGGDVTGAEISYNVHLASGVTGSFSSINLPFESNLDNIVKDQRWQEINAGVDLISGLPCGTYHLEVFWKAFTNIGDRFDGNGGANFTATFTITDPGFFDDNGACAQCPAGSFCPGDGNSYPCSAGFYASSPGSIECTACATECPAGQIISTPCTATSNTVCFACDDNSQLSSLTASGLVLSPAFDPSILSYSASTECLTSVDVTATAVSASSTLSGSTGTVALTSGVNILTVTVTSECLIFTTDYTITIDNSTSPGFYNDNGVCTECPAGSFCPGDGTVSLCPVGSFSASPGAAECELCLAGTAQNQIGSTSCVACPAGTFSNIIGAENCTACASGEYQDQPGSVDCIACDAGSTSPPGSIACTPCAAGEYIDNGICTECPPGSFCPGDGTKTLCPAGRYSDVSGASECLQCLEGTFSGNEGATFCTQCPAGTFSDVTGASACAECPAGTFQANTGATTCDACDPGFCQEETGQTACTACSSADLVLTPSSSSVSECDTITVMVSIVSEDSYNTVEARLNFDPTELKVLAVTAPDGSDVITNNPPFITPAAPVLLDNTNGEVAYAASTSSAGTSGDQDFMRITFEVLGNSGLASLTPITSGFPRSRVATTEFIDGVATPVDILDEFLPIDLTLNPDSEAPVFTCPSNATVDVDANCAITIPDLITGLMGTDNCGSVSFSQSPTAGTIVPASHNQVIDVTITADDGNTNQSTCTVSLTAQDVTSPSITCTSDFTLYVDVAGQASIASDGSIELANSVNDFSSIQGEKDWSYGEYPAFNTAAFSQLTYNEGNARYEGGASFGTPFITPTNAHPSFNNNDWAVRRWTSNFSGTVTLSGEFQDVDLSGGDGVHVRIYQNGTQIYEYLNVPGSVITYSQNTTVAIGDEIDFIVDAKSSPNNDDTRFTAVITAQGASATDNCASPTITATNISFDCSSLGANTVTYTATDLAGNTASCTATVTIVDDTAPTLTCNADITETNDNNLCSAVVTYTNNFSDNCAIQTTVQTAGLASGSVFPVGTTTNTFVVTDASGNSSTCSFDVTVVDSQAPDVSCMDITVQLDANGMASITPEDVDNNSTDNCGIVSRTLDISTFDCGDVGANTVTLTVTDVNGNSSTCTATVTVEDNVAPTAICQDITIQLDASGNATLTPGLQERLDAGESPKEIFDSGVPLASLYGLTYQEGLIFYMNTTTGDGMIAAPSDQGLAPWGCIFTNMPIPIVQFGVLTGPGAGIGSGETNTDGIILGCPTPGIAARVARDYGDGSWFLPSIGELTEIYVNLYLNGLGGFSNDAYLSSTQQGSPYAHRLVFGTNNIFGAEKNQPIRVRSVRNFSASGTGSSSSVEQLNNNSTDNCGGLTFSADITDFTCSDIGPNTVTLSVTDVNGNSSTCISIVTVEDNVAPTAICQDITVQLDASGAATITAAQIDNGSSDACGIQSLVLSQTDFNCADVGANAVTLTVTDNNGNVSTCTATITVEDNIAPTITCNADISVVNDAGICGAIVTYSNSSSDNCSGETISQTAGLASGAIFPVGTTTNTFVVTDASGNSATCSFEVTVTDNEAPVVTGNITASDIEGCSAADAPAAETTVAGLEGLAGDLDISENCSANGDLTVASSDAVAGTCPTVITRTYTVTDEAGNTSASFTHVINVDDTTLPTASAPTAVDVQCSGDVPAVDITVVTDEADNCGTTVVAYAGDANNGGAGTTASPLVITRTYSVTDACGNSIDVDQIITVIDDTAPVLAGVPADETVQCDAIPTAASPAATDNCDASPLVTLDEVSTQGVDPTMSDFYNYTITRTWTASDASGNSVDGVQVITVEDDTAPVLAGVPIDETVQCDAIPTAASPTATDNCDANPSVSLNEVSTQGVDPALADFYNYTITRTWTAEDASGNSVDGVQVITVEDDTAPVLAGVPADETVQCDAIPTAASPTATDNCDANPSVSLNEVSTQGVDPTMSDFYNYTITRTWTATDASGNSSSDDQLITVEDDTAPVLAGVPVDETVQCDAIPAAASPTVTDNCDASPLVTLDEVSTQGVDPALADFYNYTITRTWTATDASGNSSSDDQVITVEDDTAPVLAGVPADETVQCDAIPTAASPTATDNCDASPLVTLNEVSTQGVDPALADFYNYTITRTWTASDASGNSVDGVQVITVEDDTAPVLAGVPADETVQCDAIPTAASPTATDNCDASPLVTLDEVSTQGVDPTMSDFYNYTITRTWTASDASGNSVDGVQVITVEDDTAPVLAGVPIDETVQCDAIPTAASPTATDNCDASPLVTLNEVSTQGVDPALADFYNYTITRTWTASDASGNSVDGVQVITVEDDTAPVLAGVPVDETVQCDAIPTAASPTATDNCDASPSVTLNEVSTQGVDPTMSDFYNYTITRTWTATDASGNSSSDDQVITVEDDTAPVLAGVPVDETVQCDAIPTAASPTVTDNCDASPLVTLDEVSTQGVDPTLASFYNYTITRTWTATDASGNSSSDDQVITVEDDTAPVLAGVPADETVQCDAIPTAASPTATDNCDASPLVTLNEVSTQGVDPALADFYNYTITRTWTASDASGNSVDGVQVITVDDDTAPVLAGVPADETVQCDAIPTAASPTATDNCDASPSVTLNEVSTQGVDPALADFYNYTITRTWTATDASGNSSSDDQVITVEDDTAPVLAGVPADETVQCDAIPTAASPTATDNCDANPSVSLNEVSTQGVDPALADFYNYTITRTWTASDASGNSSSDDQVITVEDDTAPVLAGVPADETVQCDAIPMAASPTATDNCDASPSVTLNEVSTQGADPTMSDFYNYTITRTWTATDASGNSSSDDQVITVEDDTAPVLAGVPANETVQCDAVPTAASPTATDNCDASPSVTLNEVSTQGADPTMSDFYNYTITRTWTASDASGNSSSDDQVITVEDNTAPVLNCPEEVIVSNEPDACGVIVNFNATAVDNCNGPVTITYSQDPGSFFDVGTTFVTLTATDASGNISGCGFSVTVNDAELPVITCVGDATVTVNQTNNTYLASGGEFDPTSVSDNCPGVTVSHDASLQPGTSGTDTESLDGWEFPVGTTTITFTATDASGNEVTCTFDIVVENAVISGEVTLNGDCLPLDMTVTVYETGTPSLSPTLVATFTNVEIDTDGSFEIDAVGVVPGDYDIYLKPENYLARRVGDVAVSGLATGINITNMVPGDISTIEDNRINGDDISLILNAYNTALDSGDGNPDPLYNPDANINCDGFVDALDLSLIIFFFPSEGDSPLLPE